jgi:hypothetical protein
MGDSSFGSLILFGGGLYSCAQFLGHDSKKILSQKWATLDRHHRFYGRTGLCVLLVLLPI